MKGDHYEQVSLVYHCSQFLAGAGAATELERSEVSIERGTGPQLYLPRNNRDDLVPHLRSNEVGQKREVAARDPDAWRESALDGSVSTPDAEPDACENC